MRGFSKRKPYLFSEMSSLDFWRSPVRHLLESLQRESALEKPYAEGSATQQKHHRVPRGGGIGRLDSYTSEYLQRYRYEVWYNRPEYELDIFNVDCDGGVTGDITKGGLGSPLYTGEDTAWYSVQCDDPGILIEPGTGQVLWWTFRGLLVSEEEKTIHCRGTVQLAGAWVSEEEKFVNTKTVSETTVSTPGYALPTSTIIRTGSGESVDLKSFGNDPFQTSIAGTSLATRGAIRTSVAMAGSGRPGQLGRTIPLTIDIKRDERVMINWFTDPGRPIAWFSSGYVTEAIEVDLPDCRCGSSYVTMEWDSDESISAIGQSDSGTVAVKYGEGPYSWTISGTDFTLDHASTEGKTNTLIAGASACGTATITVTDACDIVVEEVVLCTAGEWSEIAEAGDADCVGWTGVWITSGKYRYYGRFPNGNYWDGGVAECSDDPEPWYTCLIGGVPTILASWVCHGNNTVNVYPLFIAHFTALGADSFDGGGSKNHLCSQACMYYKTYEWVCV